MNYKLHESGRGILLTIQEPTRRDCGKARRTSARTANQQNKKKKTTSEDAHDAQVWTTSKDVVYAHLCHTGHKTFKLTSSGQVHL
jgi:hypothetical protein